jgi:uncharacterized protein
MPSTETIQKVLADLEQGFGPSFFAHVADNVSWTVTGRTSENPVAGHYTSKEAIKGPYSRVGALMKAPIKPKIRHVLLGDDGQSMVVEFTAMGQLKSGGEYALESCWICKFEGDIIVEIRGYMDSAHMKKVLEETSDTKDVKLTM